MIFNYDVTALQEEITKKFDMLNVSGVEAYYSLSDVASYLSDFPMGYMAIVRIASTAASVFFEAGTAKPTLCFFLKASSTNAYFLATTQDHISIGNLNVTTSVITVLKDLATNGDVQNLFDNLYVSFSTPYNSLSDLTTYLSTKSTGDLIVARVTSSLSASFFESGSTSYSATCFIYKASSTNAYFFAYTRDDVSIGNIGISTSTITSVKDLAHQSDLATLSTDVSSLSTALGSLTTRSITYTYSANAGANANANLKSLIDADLPSGYTFLAIAGYGSGNANVVIYSARYANNNYSLGLKNIGTTAVSNASAEIQYLCIKN